MGAKIIMKILVIPISEYERQNYYLNNFKDHLRTAGEPLLYRRLFIGIPAIWKHAIITPVPKPCKPAKLETIAFPISLLYPAVVPKETAYITRVA